MASTAMSTRRAFKPSRSAPEITPERFASSPTRTRPPPARAVNTTVTSWLRAFRTASMTFGGTFPRPEHLEHDTSLTGGDRGADLASVASCEESNEGDPRLDGIDVERESTRRLASQVDVLAVEIPERAESR